MGLLDELFGGATGNGIDLEAILQKAAAGLQRHSMGPLEAQSTAARVAAMPERVEQPQDVRSFVNQGSEYTPPPQATGSAPAAKPQFAGRQPTMQQRVMNAFSHLQGSGTDIDRAAETENMTVRALMSRGMDQDTAMTLARNPTALQQALLTLAPKRPENSKLGPGDAVFGPDGKLVARNDVAAPRDVVVPADSTLVRDGKPLYTTGPKPEKPPAGFEWVDPNDKSKGLSAIPGGPGEHISSEVAGRLALMKTAREGIKQTRGVYEKAWGYGDLSKQIGSQLPVIGDLAHVSGDIGIANRNIRTGVEAALRVMTGAAAPETEVARYAAMFTPGAKDTIESAKQKLDALEKFMENAEEMATRGRRVTKPGNDEGWKDVAPGVRIRERR